MQAFSPMTDLVPQAIRDLLAFYKERYPDARFGDLDVTVLQSAVDSIDLEAQSVVKAEEALAAARASYREVEVEISQKAARALSFLKIFVDGDAEPLAKLELIAASMPATRRKLKAGADSDTASGEPRQRRRRAKNSEEAAEVASVELVIDPVLEADSAALVTQASETEASETQASETQAPLPAPRAAKSAAE